MFVDGHELPGLDLTHEGGTDDVQRCGFAGNDPAALQAAQAQRPDALRVARAVQGVLVEEHQENAPATAVVRQGRLVPSSRRDVRRTVP